MTASVKERPIIMSAPMVRALLDGRKTQTRRVVKTEVDFVGGRGDDLNDPSNWGFEDGEHGTGWWTLRTDGDTNQISCPYGEVGDRLWVRETWQAIRVTTDPETGLGDGLHHAHDIPPAATAYWSVVYAADPVHDASREDRGFPWRPSIYMPKWASRITLELTGVGVERVQAISEADAVAEGIVEAGPDWELTARVCFRVLWDSLNEKRAPWDSNCWVWVLSFRVIPE